MINFKVGDRLITRGPKGSIITGKVIECKQILIDEEYEDLITIKMEDGTTLKLQENSLTNVEILKD